MNRQDMLENPVYEKLCRCVQEVKKKIDFQPEVALVLGSGLGEYAREMDVKAVVPYKEIPGFPVSTVAGHQGRFLFGYVKQVPVVAMQGRVHYYEGYPITDVVLPVRLMGLLGAKKLILTNAAGGVNFSFNPGTLMVITDHIASMVPNPLIGPNMEELGTRFPDMSEIYDRKLREIILQAGRNTGVSLQQGVYVQLTGPSYESPAEIRMCRAMGADAVGMSTACEAVAARHMGLQVCGISCITNMAAGMSGQPLNHEEVQETADRVAEEFCRLVTETIGLMGAEKGS
ncbi:MAG: purine-nucleoside phosphorylase [Oliverpabstia sp.]|nr:purine-nucleoside phosphorylase [Oliverpabstia sp.]